MGQNKTEGWPKMQYHMCGSSPMCQFDTNSGLHNYEKTWIKKKLHIINNMDNDLYLFNHIFVFWKLQVPKLLAPLTNDCE